MFIVIYIRNDNVYISDTLTSVLSGISYQWHLTRELSFMTIVR